MKNLQYIWFIFSFGSILAEFCHSSRMSICTCNMVLNSRQIISPPPWDFFDILRYITIVRHMILTCLGVLAVLPCLGILPYFIVKIALFALFTKIAHFALFAKNFPISPFHQTCPFCRNCPFSPQLQPLSTRWPRWPLDGATNDDFSHFGH